MSQSQTEQLELSIEEAKRVVAMGEALDRLNHNADFNLIVVKGYMQEEAIRLAHLQNDPTVPVEQRDFLKVELVGPGALTRYLRLQMKMAEQAANELQFNEEELESARVEED